MKTIEVGLPRELHDPLVAEAVSETAREIWCELGLLSRPRVNLSGSSCGQVAVDGRICHVSARRIEIATLAGSGDVRHAGELGAPRALLASRLAEGSASTRADVLAHVVDASLRANAAGLVRAEAGPISRALLGDEGSARELDTVREAISLAAGLGLAPAQLAGRIKAGDADPYRQCEWLLCEAARRDELKVVIELHPTTLRRLTTGSDRFRTELVAANGSSEPWAIKDDLFTDYGVQLPGVSLRPVGQDEALVRFRFGSTRSPAHLILPSRYEVWRFDTGSWQTGTSLYIDPAHGREWTVVPSELQRPIPMEPVDPAALVMRALLAEARTRLALWSPALGIWCISPGCPSPTAASTSTRPAPPCAGFSRPRHRCTPSPV